MTNSRILITGAAGFVGSNLANQLIKSNHQVFIIDNLSNGNKKFINKKAIFFKENLLKKNQVSKIIDSIKPEVIFHLAANISLTESIVNPQKDAQNNIIATLNLLEGLKNQSIKKFIFSSSGGAIYKNTGKPTDEESQIEPLSPYGVSKLSCENYLKYYGLSYKFPYAILRYSNIYGSDQIYLKTKGVIATLIKQIKTNQPLIVNKNLTNSRDYIYIKDVVSANLKALNYADNGIFNISSGKATNLKKLIKLLSKFTTKKLIINYKNINNHEQSYSCLVNQLAINKLNWQPKYNLENGLKEMFEND